MDITDVDDVSLPPQDAGFEVEPIPLSARTIRRMFDDGVRRLGRLSEI